MSESDRVSTWLPSRRAALRGLFVAAALGVAALGCNTVDAGNPHAGQRELVPPDRAWRLWYLVPPWELLDNTAARATLSVPLRADEIASGGHTREVIGLEIGTAPPGDAAAALTAAVQLAVAHGARILYPPRTVALTGGSGLEFAYAEPTVVVRQVITTLPDGRLAYMVFRGGVALDRDADIDRMIAQFEPRSPPVDP